MTPFSSLSMWLNPVATGAELGLKIGGLIGSNVLSGQKATANLSDVFKAPAQPLIINQAPKTGLDALGIGFIEKNVIIIGLLALGGLAIYRTIK